MYMKTHKAKLFSLFASNKHRLYCMIYVHIKILQLEYTLFMLFHPVLMPKDSEM